MRRNADALDFGRRWLSRRWLLCCLALAVLLLSGMAHADAYEDALTRAIVAKEQALDSNQTSDWEAALSRLQEVRQVRETKEAMYELGFVAARLNLNDLAVEAYQVALELGLSGSPREKASAFLNANKQRMARVAVRGPAGAVVSVADTKRGVLPLARPLVVVSGAVLVRVQTSDGRFAQHQLKLAPGQATEFVVTEPKPAASPTPNTSAAPAVPPALQAEVVPVPVGTADTTQGVEVGGTQGASTAATVLLWSGVATTVASGVTIVYSNRELQTARRDAAHYCEIRMGDEGCSALEPNRDLAQDAVDRVRKYKSIRLGAWIGAGVGAAALLTGLSLSLFASEQRVALQLTLTPNSSEVGLLGRF